MTIKISESEELELILRYYLDGKIDTLHFRNEFETKYNLNTDHSKLSEVELDNYDKLLDIVSWYSPFPNERGRIPNYIDETAVLSAVIAVAHALGFKLQQK